jgi:hypothetical protein
VVLEGLKDPPPIVVDDVRKFLDAVNDSITITRLEVSVSLYSANPRFFGVMSAKNL